MTTECLFSTRLWAEHSLCSSKIPYGVGIIIFHPHFTNEEPEGLRHDMNFIRPHNRQESESQDLTPPQSEPRHHTPN